MQTKLLDRVLDKAKEISIKNNFKCVNSQCVYLSILSVCEEIENSAEIEFDKDEYKQLSENLQRYQRQSGVSLPQPSDSEADRKWNREFRIWLSMSRRSALDAFKYVKPMIDSLEAGPEQEEPVKEINSGQDTEAKDGPAGEAEDAGDGSGREEDEIKSVDGLVKKSIRLREYLLERIVGQNHAVRKFADGYFEGEFNSRLDQGHKGPKGIFLFAGSPGVGKTYLATEAANALGIATKRFDMSGYASDGSVFDLTGANANYKSPQPGELTGFVHDNPSSLLIFDEVEKAHYKVINLFLQVLDTGILYDNMYEENVSFQDTIIIFTTNAGKQLYKNRTGHDFTGVSKKVILDALEKDVNPATEKPFFPQAICSRLASGYVFMFNHLSASDLTMIAARKLLEQQENLKKEFSILSNGCEDLATTILFSVGGNCDARNINGASKRFFATELFELFRLVPSDSNIKSINWILDIEDADPKVKELYEFPSDVSFLLYGEENALDEKLKWSGKGNLLFASSIEEARDLLRDHEVTFIAVDYLCGAKGGRNYLNNEDVQSAGKEFFSEIKKYYPDTPVYIWETPKYTYTREERISLMGRGAANILHLDLQDYERFESQVNQLLIQLWQQKSLENLSVKHQVLTYDTAQTVSSDGIVGNIMVYNLQLATAVEADEQDVVLSAEEKPNVHWEDIVVSEDAKAELQYFQEYLKNPKSFLKKGAKAPKGILLYGPPGTGKTSLAKVMATESDVTFLSASADQFISKWAGEGPQSVHRIFSVARKYAPAILFIDEIDAVGSRRTMNESHDGRQEILNALLTEMDGFKTSQNKPVLVMAATNLGGNNGNTGALDPALVRRFDRSICIDLPDKEGRKKLLKILCGKNAIVNISDQMIESLSERSVGMSPALIEGSLNAAIREAIRSESTVTDEIMDEAFEKYNSGEEKHWDQAELLKTARHEAGHAFVCHYFGESPSYLTIVARDDHGGYMMNGGSENKGSYTKKELLNRIAVALGGRAAEIAYYGGEEGLTTGPSGDLETATSIAKRMICSYGMYSEICEGVISPNQKETKEINSAVSKIIREQLEAALKIIRDNKDIFDQFVDTLMEKNHLNKEEMQKILGCARNSGRKS